MLLTLILPILSFIAFSTVLVSVLKLNFFSSLFFTSSFTMVSIYILGFILPLNVTSFLIEAIYLGLFFKFFRINKEYIKRNLGNYLILGLLIFVAVLINYNLMFKWWDELASWGVMLKEMSIYNRHLALGDEMYIPNYPPGVAVLQYFFSNTKIEKEWVIYFAHSIITIIPLLTIFDIKELNKFQKVILFFSCLLFVAVLAEFGIQAIYVDTILATYCIGFFLFTYNEKLFELSEAWKLKTFFYFLIISSSIVLIKQAGLIYLILTYIYILSISLVQHNKKINYLSFSKFILFLSLIFYISLMIQSYWVSRELKVFPSSFTSSSLEGTSLSHELVNPSSDKNKTIISNFLKAIQDKSIIINSKIKLAILNVWAFIFILFLANLIFSVNRWRSISAVYFILLISFLFLLFGLLKLYLFKFNDFEGLNLASYERYVSSFISFIVPIGLIFLLLISNELKTYTLIIVVIVVLIITMPNASRMYRFNEVNNQRLTLQKSIEKLKSLDAQAKIFVIWQGTTGFEIFNIRYELLPRKINVSCWSLGFSYHENDIWSCMYSADELKDYILKNFNYVFFASIDEKFESKYSHVFLCDTRVCFTNGSLFEVKDKNIIFSK